MRRGSSTFEANLKPDQVSGGLGAAAQARTQNQAVSAQTLFNKAMRVS